MPDEVVMPSGQSVDDSVVKPDQKDTVQYETYKKVLSEKKALQAKLEEFNATVKAGEQAKLEEQGKLKELNDALRRESEALKKTVKEKDFKYGSKVLKQEIKSVAKSLGAQEETLEDIYKLGDWTTVEITDDFEVKQESVKDALTEMLKAKPYLFKTSKPAPNDLPLNGSKDKPHSFAGPVDLSKLKPDDFKRLLAIKLAPK